MIVVLCGAPGAGKGTQAQKIHDELGFAKISTGDAFRANIESNTKIGLEAKTYMDRGLLVPDALTCRLLETEISAVKARKILLDGFPRNVNQAETFAATSYGSDLSKVIYLEVSEDVLVERLSNRRVCSTCRRVFHLTHVQDGKCGHCGSEVNIRSDDAPDKIRERFKVYNSETRPMLDFYQNKGFLHTVNGQRAEGQVFAEIKTIIK